MFSFAYCYSTTSNGRRHLNFEDRKRLARKWNSRVDGLDYSLSINSFAKENGISPKLWRRELKRNKGPRQKLTANIADEFSRIVKDEHRSVYHAREELKRRYPDKVIPSLCTFYNYIKSGQIGVKYGETPVPPGT